LIIEDWEVIHKIEDPEIANTDKCWMMPMPGFNTDTFPFFISSSFKQFSIINVTQGTLQPLIDGSAMTSTGQESFFYEKNKDGFTLNFCTRNHHQESEEYEFNWF
jgi:hypothetical protein